MNMKHKSRQKAEIKPPSSELLDMEQAIAVLKTTRPTFYRWLRAGKLKGSKIGRQWRFQREDIDRFLKGQEPQIDLPADITPLLQALHQRLQELGVQEQEPQENEVARAVRAIIQLAAKMRASDLHIEPQPDGKATLRYRLNGALQSIVEIDLRLLPAIIQHWKTLAACNVRETARPQEGRIRAEVAGVGRLELRVMLLPTALGESLSAVLLDPAVARLDLQQLGYSQGVLERLNRRLNHWGTIVFTGPSGCGKTSALYACLHKIAASPDKTKIITVEYEPEYLLAGTTQVPVRTELGMNMGSVLRSVLRSGPDVIMVGEIPDAETLALALQAGMTGHRVLISLHTSEAATALQRMMDAGANSMTMTDSTKLIIGQRLVRTLCPKCMISAAPSGTCLNQTRTLARLSGLAWDDLPTGFREPAGCKECNHTGFVGRTVIAEALEMTPRIATAVARGASGADLRAIAVSEGMVALAADGLRCAAEGKTSLAEIIRTVGPIYGAEMNS